MTPTREQCFMALMLSLAITYAMAGSGRAEKHWIYEMGDSVAFYESKYPDVDWMPYISKLDVLKEAIDRNDEKLISRALLELLAMLRTHQHGGLPTPAARELYELGLKISGAVGVPGSGERSRTMMTAPDSRTKPLLGDPLCHEAGCDWLAYPWGSPAALGMDPPPQSRH